jgi:uncharacterized membrane protein
MSNEIDRPAGPPRVSDEHVGFNGRLAAALTRRVGSMWAVYFTIAFMLAWMSLATWGPLHRLDPYPFAFLLFIGNVVQLLLMFVIMVGQQVLGRAGDRRALRTYSDAEAILNEVIRLHSHLEKQDRILNRGVVLVEDAPHPRLEERKVRRPPRVREQYVGVNGHIAAFVTERIGSMWAFYAAALIQFGWMGLAEVGVLGFDPYPFAFLLFLSNLVQLILMLVIMVGQQVLGAAADRRSLQTYSDAEAILHECRRLQRHLTMQDEIIVKISDYIKEHAPKDHPIHLELGQPAPQPAT